MLKKILSEPLIKVLIIIITLPIISFIITNAIILLLNLGRLVGTYLNYIVSL